MAHKIIWNDRFNLGVASIDKAHQKLFSIVQKMVDLNESGKNQEWICNEGVKFFKHYAINHFADEEAYMRSIGYSDYASHKRIHDNMKNNTLPALEKDMAESEFSDESVQHFLGICIGWLTGHIMLQDHAITGQIENKWKCEWTEASSMLKETAIRVMDELFGLKMEIVSEHFGGEDFGKETCFRLTYLSDTKKQTQVFFIYEERLILYFINHLIGIQLEKVNKVVINAVEQISQQFMKRISMYYNEPTVHKLKSSHLLTKGQLREAFDIAYPKYSLLFNTGAGYFALCLKVTLPKT